MNTAFNPRGILGAAAVALLTALTGCADETGGGAGSDSSADVKIEQARLIYLPDQSDGNFHTAFVLVSNPGKEAVEVSGQVDIKDASGTLVKSLDPNPITVGAGQEGVILEDAIDLPKPVKRGKLDAALAADPATSEPVKVQLSDLGYSVGEFDCKLRGKVESAKEQEDLGITALGFVNGKIVTGATETLDRVLAGRPNAFEASPLSKTLCPERIAKVKAYVSPGPLAP